MIQRVQKSSRRHLRYGVLLCNSLTPRSHCYFSLSLLNIPHKLVWQKFGIRSRKKLLMVIIKSILTTRKGMRLNPGCVFPWTLYSYSLSLPPPAFNVIGCTSDELSLAHWKNSPKNMSTNKCIFYHSLIYPVRLLFSSNNEMLIWGVIGVCKNNS